MGRKRNQQQPTKTSREKDDGVKLKKDDRSKKTYMLTDSKSETDEVHQKVVVQHDLEKEIIALIQEEHKNNLISSKELSKRLTTKKLTDMYSSLSSAGFSHTQIQQAMENTVVYGGDLIDSLDWLCLNLPNDKLPDGFSETLEREEIKSRPGFDTQLHHVKPSVTVANSSNQDQRETKKEKTSKSNMKDWILQYAEYSDDEEEEDDEYGNRNSDNEDPNEKYLILVAKLLDAKEAASEAKSKGDNQKRSEITKTIRDLTIEINAIEQHPGFNPAVKLKDVSTDTEQSHDKRKEVEEAVCTDIGQCQSHDQSHDKAEDEDIDMNCGAFALFEQQENPPVDTKESKANVSTVKQDVRSFEYTRQQWTGKSPKQFLIDWCRKHKSEAPKYQRIDVGGNLYKSRVRIDRKKEGKIDVCPDILCENIKEAEHLGSTLALYHLCKGQAVHLLLPPPYKAVWLEWLDAEKTTAKEVKSAENKPRDQLISKLMKKLHLSDKVTTQQQEDNTDTAAASWEDLDDEDLEISTPHPVNKTKEQTNKPTYTMNGKDMKKLYTKRQESEEYQRLLATRKELPVYQHKDIILEKINNNNVVVIAGETGSGKSTQIPQFVLEHYIGIGNGDLCNIVCTEPRRISAISLANRVSQEIGESCPGKYDSYCGYQIRFDSKKGPNAHLVYCTTGVVLRQLQTDTSLSSVTHVIVDEVHERSVQSDFLLIILKRILQTRKDLKVILMSATLDSEKFSSYFHHCPVINIPGRTYPVEIFYLEDAIEMTGYVLEDDSPYALRQDQLISEEQTSIKVTEKGGEQTKLDIFWTKDNISSIDRTDLSSEDYSLQTRNIVTRLNTDRINMDLIVDILLFLEKSDKFCSIEGSVLIFLPGLADIQELYDILTSDRKFSDPNRYRILALHSVLSSSDQTAAFKIPPKGTRKIVLATNIAETGITIPDVVFVIDSGKAKETRYMETSRMSALREVFISKANAKQRQGRAGRVREGFCFRIFTHEKYRDMAAYTVPEIQRVPLEELCLHIMKCHLGDPNVFLSEGLDPPRPQAITMAMDMLFEVGACKSASELTPLGHHLAALPVNVKIGKMLLFGAIFGYLEPVAVIAAAMTTTSPFAAPLQKLDLAQTAKMSLATSCSDHLTVYKAYISWEQVRSEGRQAELQFCQKMFLKHNTLLEIKNVKEDLIKLLKSIGFSEKVNKSSYKVTKSADIGDTLEISKVKSQSSGHLDVGSMAMIKAVIAAGLYPNVAKVTYKAPVDAAANPTKKVCIAETSQGPAHVHPSSVNRFLSVNGWIVYQEKVTTSKVYLRESCLVSPLSLLLFGGEIQVHHVKQLVTVDDHIIFQAYARTGVMFRELRKLLDLLLEKKLNDPSVDLGGEKIIQVICKLLQTEKTAVR